MSTLLTPTTSTTLHVNLTPGGGRPGLRDPNYTGVPWVWTGVRPAGGQRVLHRHSKSPTVLRPSVLGSLSLLRSVNPIGVRWSSRISSGAGAGPGRESQRTSSRPTSLDVGVGAVESIDDPGETSGVSRFRFQVDYETFPLLDP